MEYEKVLIPTDFSDYAVAAVQQSAGIPGIREVTLLHVITPREQSRYRRNVHHHGEGVTAPRDRLERDRAFLEAMGIRTTVLIESSHHSLIARTILDIAQNTGASLIAIGARGRGRIREFLLGSVSHDVIRNARQHVLLMHPSGGASARRPGSGDLPPLFFAILCPVDLSKPSEETVHSLLDCPYCSKVILLHVIRTAESLRHLDLLRQRATIRLSATKEQLEQQGIAVDMIIRTGDPVLITCTVAEREDASLILLSRYGRFDYIKNIPIGSTAEAIALRSTRPVLIRFPQLAIDVTVRELSADEFAVAEQIWEHYHQKKADRTADRIFGVFVEGTIAGVARCKRHPDGNEVDGVFVLHEFRDRGYARRLMQVLIEECGSEVLYMHSTLELVTFYRSFGFEPIPEKGLPSTIRERFNFALGNIPGSGVCPMKRTPRLQPPE